MSKTPALAFDKDSVRSYDRDGRLHVAKTPISKAGINNYIGSSIPGYQSLGLDAQREYRVFRPPEELKKAEKTFDNLPLLNTHVPVSSENPRKEYIVGTTGSDGVFEHPYLFNSLAVWVKDSIDLIESKESSEISASYHYRPEITPGVWEGQAYDIVMRDITGNHVIHTPKGRAGSDVCVHDACPEEEKMPLMEALRPYLSKDADVDKVAALLKKHEESDRKIHSKLEKGEEKLEEGQSEIKKKLSADENKEEEKKAKDKKVCDTDRETDVCDEEEDEGKKAEDSLFMRPAAITAMIKKSVREEYQKLRLAEDAVHPLVGKLPAMDSADDVYRYALKAAGIKTSGIHPSAYPAMVEMLKVQQAEKRSPAVSGKSSYAMDSGMTDDFKKMFPNAAPVGRI